MNVRGRLLVAVLLATAVVATGVLSERVLGTRGLADPRPVGDSTGGWLCPHGGGEGHRAWIVAVNPSDRPADVTVTSYAPEAGLAVREVVPPGTQRYFEVPAERPASATLLEFFGPPVTASMVTVRGSGEGLAAEPCASSAARRWYVPVGTTLRGQTAAIVAFNPSAQEAVIEVSLHTEDEVIRHSNLRVVVEPGRAVAFDLNRFALGEEVVLGDVRVALGKVAVAGIGMGTESGVRTTLGVSSPATSWILPGASDAPPARVTVLGSAGEDAPFQVLAQDQDGSKVVLEEQEVSPQTVEILKVPQGAGVVVQGAGDIPFVAGRTLTPVAADVPPRPDEDEQEADGGGGRGQGGGGGAAGGGSGGGKGAKDEEPEPEPEPPAADLAATAGAARAEPAWLAPSPLPPRGGTALLVLENPGGSEATGEVTLIGDQGPVGTPIPVTVAPGTTFVLDLSAEVGEQPLAASVRLSTGSVVAAQVATGPDGYAVATGIPVGPTTAFDRYGR
jgi:hypothetical protein